MYYRLPIRIYKRYDIDLLALYHHPEFNFKKKFREAVSGYVSGKPVLIQIPEPADNEFKYETIQFQLCFHKKNDANVIRFIQNIKSGYRNSILKSIFRNSLQGVYFYYSTNIHHAEKMHRLNQALDVKGKQMSYNEKTQKEKAGETVKKTVSINKEDDLEKTVSSEVVKKESQEQIEEPFDSEYEDDDASDILALAQNMLNSM